MLQELRIRNYAIIDELDIRFDGGLTIITGETGAGKSILMGALSLILGQRADSSVILNREKKTVVEGVFAVPDKQEVKKFLEEEELDLQEELIIRRELSPNGKSRAFINDTPASLTQLQDLSSLLVDLHRQFDTLSLGSADFQMMVVDAMANHQDLIHQYQQKYQHWQTCKKQLAVIEEQKLNSTKEQDYLQFLFNELEKAAFRDNELEELEEESKLLNSSEGIKLALSNLTQQLKYSEQPVVQSLKQLAQQVAPFTDTIAELKELQTRLTATQIELDDIAEEADRLGDKVNYDAERISQIEERLNLGYKLLKKHGFQETKQLVALHEELSGRLGNIEELDDKIRLLQQQVATAEQEMKNLGVRISEGRKKQVPVIEKQVNQLLVRVGMPNARLKLQMEQLSLVQPAWMPSTFYLMPTRVTSLLPSGK